MTDNQTPSPIPAEETTSPRRDALAHVANSPNRVPVAIALMLAGAALLGGFVGAGLAGGTPNECVRALDAAEDQRAIFADTLTITADVLDSVEVLAGDPYPAIKAMHSRMLNTGIEKIEAKAAPMRISADQFNTYSDKCRG